MALYATDVHIGPGRQADGHQGRIRPPSALTLTSWVAVAFAPVVVACQGWTHWMFRRRLTA
jgi:hypothetical protein